MSCREGRADPEMRSAKCTALCRALQSWFEELPYHTEVPEGGQEDESLQASPFALLGPLYHPGWTSEGPLLAAGLSQAEVPVS